jgi:RNA polymerase sigma-70 factor (ECF subfamily)
MQASLSERLIREARRGDQTVLADLLQQYRNYLLLLARLRVGSRLRVKVDESDLVQETLLQAWRSFGGFRGHSEQELMQWLRCILARTVVDQMRHHGADKRNMALEQQLQRELDQSSRLMDVALRDREPSPSQNAVRHEWAKILADAMATLPADYQQVITLRHLEGMTLVQIAARLGRSADSIQKVWTRALMQLHEAMKDVI